MDDLVFNVKALATLKDMTIEELAKACGIGIEHLKNVSSGRAAMTAKDLILLSKFTGVNPDRIKFD